MFRMFKWGSTVIILIIFNLIACKNKDSFQKSDQGFSYKIISESSDTIAIKEGDHIQLSVKYYTSTDSLLFNTDEIEGDFRMNVSNSSEDGLLHEAVKMMRVGDSAHFLINATNFYEQTAGIVTPDFIDKNEDLKFEIKVTKMFTNKELDLEYEQYLLRLENQEKLLLSEYLNIEEITVNPTQSGLYIIPLEYGTGKKAQKNMVVSVHYVGKLINGEIFDSSLESGKPLEFTLGKNEVIPAWEESVSLMREGDKIMIIAPSYTAYGKRGYPPFIPPYATLIFEMKLIEVKE
jgi:FKBP-type peptidyl-prolyl cis-trans isomerase FkpA